MLRRVSIHQLEGQLEVDLPTAGAAVTSTPIPEALVVSILKDGRVAVAGEVTPDDQLFDVLKLRREKNPKLALVIDAEVKCSGRIPQAAEIVSWLTTAAAKAG